MIKKKLHGLGLFFLALVGVMGCQGSPRESPPESLIVYPNAAELAFHKEGQIWQIQYMLQEPYPANNVLSYIKQTLAQQGWQPIKEDYLNLGLSSSHERGWGSFVDATTKPASEVRQWLAQWKNQNGDVIWFALRYRYRNQDKPDLNTLKISASYLPSAVAEAGRDVLKETL